MVLESELPGVGLLIISNFDGFGICKAGVSQYTCGPLCACQRESAVKNSPFEFPQIYFNHALIALGRNVLEITFLLLLMTQKIKA